MSTQITVPPDAAESQRHGHTAALAVAALIIRNSPITPTDVKTTCPAHAPEKPSVDVYFHESAAGVEALAQALGVEAQTQPFREGDPRPYVTTDAVIDGVPVRAWSLLDPPTDVEVTA
ncbi:hypothetical protein [Streptomyces celluloflavus]|uniref:hypothetical protein n=1 Tax=Streptomyces celluloflavus TaxID=58344 RepID=UPI003650AC0A